MTEAALFNQKLRSVFSSLGLLPLLNEERAAAFYRLYLFLKEENEKYNLTAVTDMDGVILLHFADSLMGASYIPEGASLLDVGCGAGFPSLPLALCRPDITVLATDATAKKTAFVAMAADKMGLTNLGVLNARAEVAAHGELRESFSLVTARAVAALPTLLELTTPFLKVGGVFLALKGRGAKEEMEAARHAAGELKCKLKQCAEYTVGEGENAQARGILIYEKVASTPAVYPRPFKRIKERPL